MKRALNLLRKTLCTLIIRLCLEALRLLKIKRNRILFSSYMEKQYSCNPKYIFLEMKRLYGEKIEIGWAFRRPEKYAYLEKEGVRVLKTGKLSFYLYAMTSKVIVTNTYFKPTLPRRRGTFIVNTWHGGGAYKRVGKYQEMGFIERFNTRLREGGTKLFLSSGGFFTQNVIRESFGYKGEVLECGMPRNDILLEPFSEQKAESIRRKVGVLSGKRLCLYAPTYRRDTKPHSFGLDVKNTLSALKERFGGDWIMGYRSHHVSMFKDNSEAAADAVDLSLYEDMQELLYVSDALITDYSSSIWDAALCNKNVFLYAPDLNEYLSDRSFYTDIHTWGFPLSQSNEELQKIIREFDREKYLSGIKQKLIELESRESGEASKISARRIGREMGLNDD